MPRIEVGYSDLDAKGLLRCIVDWVEISGGFVLHTNTKQDYSAHTGRWSRSSIKVSAADVIVFDQDTFIVVRIAHGEGKPNSYQEKMIQTLTNAGGLYFEAKDFESFYLFYESEMGRATYIQEDRATV
jgi:hypothetical protein